MTEAKRHKRCPTCGAAFVPFPGPEASDIIEVAVQAHIRRIQRQRYRKGCACPQVARDHHGPSSPTADPQKPVRGVGMDAGVAGQIPLWAPDASLM